MPGKIAKKIAGLAVGVSCNERYVSFSFTGPEFAVREAVRDAYCGLRILSDIPGELRFLSEELKMAGHVLQAPSNTHIRLSIATEAFERLVQMYHYCSQIGAQISSITTLKADAQTVTGAAVSTDYLDKVAAIAATMEAPLVIPEHVWPPCSLLWTQEELEHEASEIGIFWQSRKAALRTLFHTLSEEHQQSREDWVNARKASLCLHVELLIRRHPAALHGIAGEALDMLEKWVQMQRDGFDPLYQIHANPHLFPLLRRDDVAEFERIAKKYTQLYSEIPEPPASSAPSRCAVL
ncbi:hypothetical protein Lgee_0562 [Legionella geestiana]|uniref:Uncharacterized protein n=1 Tax=Legionella geestiana TaxID=45065 RepID=A0A0W0U679_9GAMM|nr:hypothetical protein [Legionella geestiana]KTD03211.1 hypothetical protein Lgee_0562 [Legionella geestiana]QBS12219.1 hypothetical protein E4T54_05370 [Legionella geestiana]STX53049.1 Uncharacterised protein [Legionella geestiana]